MGVFVFSVYVPQACAAPPPSIPILMYHYVETPEKKNANNLFIPADIFEKQMQWLSDNDYTTISLDQLQKIFTKGEAGPSKPVVLTFDDGWEDAYTTVLPVLRRHSMTATFFLISGFLDKPNFLTHAQAQEMAADGMEMEAHTVTHPNLRTLNAKDLQYQLEESRKTLEKILGKPVVHIAYPSGKYNKAVLAAVKKAGYVTGVTTHEHFAKAQNNLLALPRLRVTSKTDLKVLLGGK